MVGRSPTEKTCAVGPSRFAACHPINVSVRKVKKKMRGSTRQDRGGPEQGGSAEVLLQPDSNGACGRNVETGTVTDQVTGRRARIALAL